MKAWFSFLLRYLIVAIIGISAIIFLVPTDKDKQQLLIQQTRNKLNVDQLSFSQLADIFKSETDAEIEKDDDIDVEKQLNIPNDTTTTQKPITKNNNQNTSRNINIKTNNKTWGIVSAPKATYYTTKGKFIGHLPPGTALNIIKITQTKKGPIAVCQPYKQSSSDMILTNPDHLTIRNNDIAHISKKLEKLYVQQAQLKAEITTIKKQKSKELRKDNPYARKYAICKKEYHDYWRKVDELTKKRNSSKNENQIEYADELRMMKGQDIRIANALKEAKEEYNNWNLAHPRPVNDDAEANKLLTELTRIGKIISSIENDS